MRHDDQKAPYPVVDMVAGWIADWVNNHRLATGHDTSLARCSPEDVANVARELGLSSGELRELVRRGPDAAGQVREMLQALGVDPAALSDHDPLLMRDLQRLCSTCRDKTRCSHELADGTAKAHFHEFCPNSYTLDALLEERSKAPSA